MNASTPDQVERWLADARRRTYELFDDLDDERLRVPTLDVVNPLLWELGHVGWFQEKFALRLDDGSPSVFDRADELYDSGRVGHEQRWALRLPDRTETRAYLERVLGAVLERLRRDHYPWGDAAAGPQQANLDSVVGDTVDVGAFAAGDSVFGCRQVLGNVWEWTSSVFGPYPGFAPGVYAEYSAPWFGTRRVLRGGACATRSRLMRNTRRNYFTPERRDVIAGFRTCAVAG